MKHTKNKGFILPTILFVVILLLASYFAYNYYSNRSDDNLEIVDEKNVEKIYEGWNTYTNNDGKFSFSCPSDWTYDTQMDYDAMIKTSSCTKAYQVSKYEFSDGIIVSVGFVPFDVEAQNKTYADNKIGVIMNQPDYQNYTNNGFENYVSMSGNNRAVKFDLNARKTTSNGYYEITAQGYGETQTDQYYKDLADKIVASFKQLN